MRDLGPKASGRRTLSAGENEESEYMTLLVSIHVAKLNETMEKTQSKWPVSKLKPICLPIADPQSAKLISNYHHHYH